MCIPRRLLNRPFFHCSRMGGRIKVVRATCATRATQRLQYPLVKEYSSNHIRDPTIIYGIYSLIKGYWSLKALAPLAPVEPLEPLAPLALYRRKTGNVQGEWSGWREWNGASGTSGASGTVAASGASGTDGLAPPHADTLVFLYSPGLLENIDGN